MLLLECLLLLLLALLHGMGSLATVALVQIKVIIVRRDDRCSPGACRLRQSAPWHGCTARGQWLLAMERRKLELLVSHLELSLLSLLLGKQVGERMRVISKLLLSCHKLLLMHHRLHLTLALKQLHILLSLQLLVLHTLLLLYEMRAAQGCMGLRHGRHGRSRKGITCPAVGGIRHLATTKQT